MRNSYISLAFLIASLSLSCNRQPARHDDESARQAGREAYRATQDLKRDAKDAERELRSAGKEFREGWNEEKQRRETSRKGDDHPNR